MASLVRWRQHAGTQQPQLRPFQLSRVAPGPPIYAFIQSSQLRLDGSPQLITRDVFVQSAHAITRIETTCSPGQGCGISTPMSSCQLYVPGPGPMRIGKQGDDMCRKLDHAVASAEAGHRGQRSPRRCRHFFIGRLCITGFPRTTCRLPSRPIKRAHRIALGGAQAIAYEADEACRAGQRYRYRQRWQQGRCHGSASKCGRRQRNIAHDTCLMAGCTRHRHHWHGGRIAYVAGLRPIVRQEMKHRRRGLSIVYTQHDTARHGSSPCEGSFIH